MPSIKVLNIALVLLCIVITAFICTFLAISSSNVALDDTKESRDTSVASCFAVGEESVQNRTNEQLEYLLTSTTDYLVQFLKPQRVASTELARSVDVNDWTMVQTWEWHRLETYYWRFFHLRPDGNTGLGVALSNRLMILIHEDGLTFSREPNDYHAIKILWNYGEAHPWGGYNRTFVASVVPGTGQPARVTSFSDFNMNTYQCLFTDVLTNGSYPDEPCYVDSIVDPLTNLLYVIGRFVPPSVTLWTPPVAIDAYLAISALTPIYKNGVYSGVGYSGADLRHISKFLQRVHVSGPVEGYPSRGRVFITVRGSWIDPRAVGLLVGSSHGVVVVYKDPNSRLSASPIFPAESDDSIVQQVALEGLNSEALALSKNTTTLNITTDLAPGGEDFYYRCAQPSYNNTTQRVGIMADPYGIDWYLHVVIDRAYILGSIDRKTAETKDAIHTAEKKVDDDLNTARTLLYILVAVVSVVLIMMSIVFVLKTTKPLIVLEKEMAMVAVMKLEGVDTERPLSSLQEVRLMQISFQQMMKNLVEYRNYMPASVLHDDDCSSEESEETEKEAVPSERDSSIKSIERSDTLASKDKKPDVSSSRASSLVSRSLRVVTQKHSALGSMDAKAKKVTLMTCNIISFLDELNDASRFITVISHYLTSSLSKVKATKGIPDSFNGDRLYVSWNGVRPCASHRTQAYTCSRAISGDTSLGKKFSIGIASGEVKCGNMGCEGMKKFSFIGSLASWVHVVERVGRLRRADIAICCATHEELVNVAYVRSIQHVLFTKHSLRTLMIYEAGKKREVVEEEWMYQLEQGASNDPNKIFNTSYELFMNGDVEGAAAMLQQSTYDMESDVAIKYKERLEAAASDPSLCEPYGKRDPIMS